MSRSCFAAATIATVAAVFPSRSEAQPVAGRPKIFSTTSSAVGVDYFPDQEGGLTPIKDTFHMQFVSGLSSMSSSNGPTARAGVADPGNGATQGPANVCPQVPGVEAGIASGFTDAGGGFIGEPMRATFDTVNAELQPLYATCTTTRWPFTTQADGFTPNSATAGALIFGEPSGQLHGDGGGAHATISDDGTSSTDSAMTSLRIAPLPGGSPTGLPVPPAVSDLLTGANDGAPVDTALFTVGSVTSTTANLFDGVAAVSRTESRVNGVRLIGGIVTIDSIMSVAESRFAPDADPTGTSSTTAQGVMFLGQPATIDDRGIHPSGSPDDNSFNEALAQAGLAIRLVGATQAFDDRGFMTARAEGITAEFRRSVETGLSVPPPPPNPITPTSPSVDGEYFVKYNLASVESRSFARDLTRAAASPGAVTPSVRPAPAVAAPTPAVQSGFTGGTVTAAPPAAQAGPAAASGSPVGFTLSFDLRWLYLAFTLVAFGMCVAPRLVLPARLPTRS